MKTIRNFLVLILLSAVLLSCNAPSDSLTPVQSNFPLKQTMIFPSNDVIEKIAVSDNWMAISGSGKITGVDIKRQKILWTVDFSVFMDSDPEFQIINDTLVAASYDQVILVNKTGQKREITLDPSGGDRHIIKLVAVYPNYLYVIRGTNWTLEVYDISRNLLLWKTIVGRGGTDVFYDAAKNITYVTTRDYSIQAFNNLTGTILWQENRSALFGAYNSGILYICEQSGSSDIFRFSAIDAENQKELWKRDFASIHNVYKLTAISDLLIASTTYGLIAIDESNGNEVWHNLEDETFYTTPVELDGVLYARGSSHTVYAISRSDGNVIGFVELGDTSFIQPHYEVFAGVYRLKDGIAFNTRNAVVIYKTK